MPELTLDDYTQMLSPSGYATVRLGWKLYPWQRLAMDPLEKKFSKVGLITCNDSGKTSHVLAGSVIWHMENFPGSMTVTTSGANRQIQFQLYPNFRRICGNWPGWRIIDSNRYSIRAPNGSICVSFATDDPGLAEGFHEPPVQGQWGRWKEIICREWGIKPSDLKEDSSLFMAVDEAKSVPQGIFDAIERCHPTRYLVASSPGLPAGPFFDVFHGHKKRFFDEEAGKYNLIHCDWTMCPHLFDDPPKHREILEQIDSRGGPDDPFIQSMIFGRFAQSDKFMVFDMKSVEKSMSGMNPVYGQGEVRAAVDLSGGGDETCLFLRRGNNCWMDNVWHVRDPNRLCRELISRFEYNELKPEWITADAGGLGDPICGILEGKGWPVNRLNFGSKPRNGRKYLNVRAEMYFNLAHRMIAGEVRVPRDDMLRDQLSWQIFTIDDCQRIMLRPKKNQPGSPDRADTVAMLYYNMPGVQSYKEETDRRRRALSPTLPLVTQGGFSVEEGRQSDEGILC